MIASIRGEVIGIEDNAVVVEKGGVGYKIFTSERSRRGAKTGEEFMVLTHLHVREDLMDLYGFLTPFELKVFKKLITISGVGPKAALNILNIAAPAELVMAINAGRAELLTRVSGIGRKTAERVVLELKGKIEAPRGGEGTIEKMEADIGVEEELVALGYTRGQAKETVREIDKNAGTMEEKLKAALKIAGKK